MKKNTLRLALFVSAFVLNFGLFAQTNSYLGLDGGFEGSATIDNATTYAGPQASKWAKANTNLTIANETGTVRSGNNALKVSSSTTSTCRVWSPQFTVSSSTTKWVVQYYRRATSTSATIQNQTGNVRGGTEQLNTSYTAVTATNTWQKVVYSPTTTTAATTAVANILAKMNTSAGDAFYDDFALYESSAGEDVTPASPPTAASASNPTATSLDVSWTAASGGVDGGGYIVVRGTTDPTTAPNVNGIYAVNNLIAAGMTVVYRGTATSFTDGSLASGTQYFYRVYTFDKAYNYSAAATCNGTTSSGTTPSVALSTIPVSAANALQGNTSELVGGMQLAVTLSSATLTGVNALLGDGSGSAYTSSDIKLSGSVPQRKLWYSTSSTFSTGTATLLATATTNAITGNETWAFTGFTKSLAIGTHYLYFTADLEPCAVTGHKFRLQPFNHTDPNVLTYSATVTKTGSIGTENDITIAANSSIAADINVVGGATFNQNILTGDLTPSTTDNTDFGSVCLNNTVSNSFRIQNITCSNALNSIVATLSGTNASDFSITATPASSVAASSAGSASNYTTLTITFAPSASGNRTASVSIASSDPDESPYTFSIQGNGSGNSIAPTTTQNIQTGNNGTALTVTETPSAGATRVWKYSNSPGGPYTNTISGQTATSYTPNFASAGSYYVICESTLSGSCLSTSNEVLIQVTNPGPPIITHTTLGNTTATTAQTAVAIITSSVAMSCTPSVTYRVNGGSWTTVNGTNPSGNTWNFSIAGQSVGSLVEYYLTACNASGTTYNPTNATTTSTYNEYTVLCPPSGSTQLAFQGFETSPPSNNWSYSTACSGTCTNFTVRSSASSSNPSTDFPASSRIRTGSQSYQHRSDGVMVTTMTLPAVTIPTGATNIKARVWIASISQTSGNGADAVDDYIKMTANVDGAGFPGTADVAVFGKSNIRYGYGATGSLSTTAGTPVSYTPSTGGDQPVNGRTLLEITIPNGASTVALKLEIRNNDSGGDEIWCLDDIELVADNPPASSGRYFRSKTSGKWENISTWEVSTTAGGTYNQACETPDYSNSDSIIVLSGHTVTINADRTVDQLMVLSGGTLVLNNKLLTFNNQANSTELTIEGTFIDNALSGNGLSFNSGAKWVLGTAGEIIKTATSSCVAYRDNYLNGISTIPATATWRYRYLGTNNVNTVAVDAFYPNLYFENNVAGNYQFSSALTALVGSSGGYATVKGNLYVGTTGVGTVTVYNNNSNQTPMTIMGNTEIATGSSLIADNSGANVNGTGFDLKGDLIVNGTLDVNSSASSGILRFSGTSTQTVSGSGTIDINVLQIQKTAQTILDLLRNITVSDSIQFTTGVIRTNANTVYLTNPLVNAITGGVVSGLDDYIQGRLQRTINTGLSYVFPIGHSTQNAQGFTITPTAANGSNILGYLETNATTPVQPRTYCDLETKPSTGVVPIGSGTAGPDGALDQITFNLASPLQWDITNPGGGVTSYNVTVHGNNGQDISPVVSAGGTPIRYLLKNGEPGNTGFTTGTGGADFPQTGFIACPNQYTLTGMTSFSKFTLNGANAGGTALPVKIISLHAKAIDNRFIKVDWTTATEVDNKGFYVERSEDGISFYQIGWVNGNGTTNEIKYYSFDDVNAKENITYYYRLQQVDVDGHAVLSQMVSARITLDDQIDVVLYPVPAKEILHIKMLNVQHTDAQLTIYNVLGQVVKKLSLTELNGTEIILNTADFSSGNYTLTLQTGNQFLNKKFVVQ